MNNLQSRRAANNEQAPSHNNNQNKISVMILHHSSQNTTTFAQGNCALSTKGIVMPVIISQEVQQNQHIYASPYILICKLDRVFGASHAGGCSHGN